MSNSSSSDEELYLWSIFLDTGSFSFFFRDVGCGFEDDVDFETGHFVVRAFNVNELLLGFTDEGVKTMGSFRENGVGVERYGVTKAEVSGL